MDRLRLSFATLVAAALLLGGGVAVDTGGDLRALDAVGTIESRVSVSVTGTDLGEDSLAVTVRLGNPTGADLRVTGARFRVYNDTNARLAGGAGTRVDDNGSALPAGGSLTATYAMGLSESQHRDVRAALDRGATLSVNVAMELGDTGFVVRATTGIGGGGA